jgi:hypothetical protein
MALISYLDSAGLTSAVANWLNLTHYGSLAINGNGPANSCVSSRSMLTFPTSRADHRYPKIGFSEVIFYSRLTSNTEISVSVVAFRATRSLTSVQFKSEECMAGSS